jgi:hypothetical protein
MHGIDEVAEGVAQEGPDQKHRHRLHDGLGVSTAVN